MMGSILIPSHYSGPNTYWLLRTCLKSLKEHQPELLNHTFIIDDHSQHPEQEEAYKNLFETFHVNIILKKEKKSYSSVINLGLNYLKKHYKWVLCMNNDIEIVCPFIPRVNEIFRVYPKCAVIGAKLYYPSGRIQHSGVSLQDDGDRIMHEKSELDIMTPGMANVPRFMMAVTGAFQVIRSSALDQIGLYDEAYSLSYEDVEFCMRTWQNGYQVFYDPDIEAIHYESATRGNQMGVRENESLLHFEKDVKKFDIPGTRAMIDSLNVGLV